MRSLENTSCALIGWNRRAISRIRCSSAWRCARSSASIRAATCSCVVLKLTLRMAGWSTFEEILWLGVLFFGLRRLLGETSRKVEMPDPAATVPLRARLCDTGAGDRLRREEERTDVPRFPSSSSSSSPPSRSSPRASEFIRDRFNIIAAAKTGLKAVKACVDLRRGPSCPLGDWAREENPLIEELPDVVRNAIDPTFEPRPLWVWDAGLMGGDPLGVPDTSSID